MKSKIIVFLSVLCFMLVGATSSVFAVTVDVTLGGFDPTLYMDTTHGYSSTPFADAEKNAGSADNPYCWAAAASNVLSWTEWDHVFTGEDAIFGDFQSNWTDPSGSGGKAKYGFEWWFTGNVTDSYYGTGATFNPGTGGYYPTTDFSTYSRVWEDNMSIMDEYSMQAIDLGYGTTLGMIYGSFDDGFSGHEITLWGYKYEETNPDTVLGVWVSDSDSHEGTSDVNTLQFYTLYSDTMTDGVNTWGIWRLATDWNGQDWIMNTLSGLLPYEDNGEGPSVPEPATIFLLGSGLLGLFVIGRRKFKRS